jgi:putative flippase GtrA
MPSLSLRTRRQVVRFGIVGVVNTLVDYVVFIGLTIAFSIPLSQVWLAKYPSSIVAMGVSFALNRSWVFGSQGSVGGQLLRFFLTTIVGVLVIQNLLTQLFSSEVQVFGKAVWHVVDALGLPLTESYTIKTVAFILATLASLTWNFLIYRSWVFRDSSPRVSLTK